MQNKPRNSFTIVLGITHGVTLAFRDIVLIYKWPCIMLVESSETTVQYMYAMVESLDFPGAAHI